MTVGLCYSWLRLFSDTWRSSADLLKFKKEALKSWKAALCVVPPLGHTRGWSGNPCCQIRGLVRMVRFQVKKVLSSVGYEPGCQCPGNWVVIEDLWSQYSIAKWTLTWPPIFNGYPHLPCACFPSFQRPPSFFLSWEQTSRLPPRWGDAGLNENCSGNLTVWVFLIQIFK